MMYNKRLLQDYASRIQNIYNNQINSTNDFTLTYSLFCGIVSIIDDITRETIFKNIQIPKYVKNQKNNYKEKSSEIMRHFRNSLCHFKLDDTSFIANAQKKISTIVFTDLDKFKCVLTVKELNDFFLFIINTILTSED